MWCYVSFQALLEFGDEDAAANMVDYHERTPAQIRLKPVFAQLSNHKELKTDYAHSFQVCYTFLQICLG